VNLTGREYVLVKAPVAQNDLAVIIGTQNGTQVNVNGSLVTTINAGQSYQYSLNAAGTAAVYVNTSNPSYVFHINTGNGEFGGAILPSLDYSGSLEVSVMRSTYRKFWVFLVTRSGNEGGFLFNGNPGVITAANFQTVPATSGNWRYASIDLSSVAIVGSTNTISNTSGLFQMGLIQSIDTGSSYAYFSGFTLFADASNESICSGNPVILNASIPNATYVWNTGANVAVAQRRILFM
jgi:hypothetical protein